jgi:peptide methionine sulfoxide reductase MsrA
MPGLRQAGDVVDLDYPLFFFQIHRPDLGEGRVGSDYRSEIFYTSDEQRQVAEDTIAAADASGMWPGMVVTKISQAGPFWAAEAEDQDYLQRYSDANNQFSTNRSPPGQSRRRARLSVRTAPPRSQNKPNGTP